MNVSVTIIGHNEADHLRELLPQLQWASEIVYVDCESQDESLEVAKEHGCLVFSRPNNPNLNVNKSFAMEQASGDWLFYIDPDERLPDLHWLRHGSQYPDTQLRLFRKGMAKFPNQHVHEKLNVLGSIGKLQNDMLHFPYRNISQFLSKFDFYTGVEAGYLRDAGVRVNFSNTLRFTVLKPFTRFFRRYIFKGGFRDGLPGLFCSVFDALNYVVRYFKLWEMSQQNSENRYQEKSAKT